jgi:hypothetical protein
LTVNIGGLEHFHVDRHGDELELKHLFTCKGGRRCSEKGGQTDKESEKLKRTHGNTFL